MEPSAGECDECFEIDFEFFVPRGESAEVFESGEAALNAIALFVEGFVIGAWLFAVAFGRDHGDRAHAGDMLNDGVAVVALVGQHRLGLAVSQQGDGLGAVVELPCGHGKVDRQAQLIGEQVDLSRQASSGTPQSLVFAPFLRPVAACWWARTMVESIIRYWFFRSRTNSWKTFSQTPVAAQRPNRLCRLLYLP